MKRLFAILILCITLALPLTVHAADATFKAKILTAQTASDPETQEKKSTYTLKVLDGEKKDQTITSESYEDPNITLGQQRFQPGETVIVMESASQTSTSTAYFIVDHVRAGAMWFLIVLFCVIVIAVNRMQGVRALAGLFLTGILFWYGALPLLFKGVSPTLVSLAMVTLVMLSIMYITHGFNKKTNVAVVATLIAIAITIALSLVFIHLATLSGVYSEEVFYAADVIGGLNPQALLLAGMIIACLGVLDDVTIGQASIVQELQEANPTLSRKELFIRGMRVGNDHAGSIVNTLILALAGSSLPTFILLYHSTSLKTFGSISPLNTELIATELTRMLVSSSGLILAMPITTLLASWWYTRKAQS